MSFCASATWASSTGSSPRRRAEKGTAFRKTSRADLDWVFTIQTERVVDKDNTVAIGERVWQLEKSRFRTSLAGATVTIHVHLDERVSIRYGPHVVGRYPAPCTPTGAATATPQGRGKAETVEPAINRTAVSHRSHRPLEIPLRRDSHFPPDLTTTKHNPQKIRKPNSASRRGSSGSIN